MDRPIPIPGIELGTAAAGIKRASRDDLVVIGIAAGASCAAVFTNNAFAAGPVVVAREHIEQAETRLLLINSGNANAGMGAQGLSDARECCNLLASRAEVSPCAVLPFSTGVIGERLPMAVFEAGIAAAYDDLGADNWEAAAKAIMTTDTVPKTCSRRLTLGDMEFTLTGIAKGSGMICPNMATMLAFIGIDASVDQAILQAALDSAVASTFNCITVDGDTSTNDACVVMATGEIELPSDAAAVHAFTVALTDVCRELAFAIVRDGEGATKFIEIAVNGANTEAEAKQVAYTIAHSPLVKTAMFASDPNWGRLLAAVGRSELEDLDVDRVSIAINEVEIVTDGSRAANYDEDAGVRAMADKDIRIVISLNRGAVSATVWTCDLSHDYVKINAEYRT